MAHLGPLSEYLREGVVHALDLELPAAFYSFSTIIALR